MSKLQSQVIAFMQAADHKIEPVPTIPERKIVALCVMLVVEETMEFVEACYGSIPEKAIVEEMIRNVLNVRETKVDMVQVSDALGDLDYTSEFSRLSFGIEGESIANAIQVSNTAKVAGEARKNAAGKVGKPSQWEPPNLAAVLMEQNAGEIPSVGDKMRGRVHYQIEGDAYYCFDQNEVGGVGWPTDTCTDDITKVTCKRCFRRL